MRLPTGQDVDPVKFKSVYNPEQVLELEDGTIIKVTTFVQNVFKVKGCDGELPQYVLNTSPAFRVEFPELKKEEPQ
jgi:hypothetical protein